MSFFTAAVAIVAIVAGVFITLIKQRYRHAGHAENGKVSALEDDILALKDRIATLEKIVTDSSYDLKKQFKDLEQDKVA
ncbi:hypothetical protein [Alteromonas sp. AMM-1]|uniref:hypothetical protein n=1 Tax=Alteromonas sp. AMM-1 TaxID=3394233 RepID=UPI0039A6181A